MLGIIQGLKDWVSFRMMVTPIILKVLFQILFVLGNLLSLVLLVLYVVTGLLGIVALFTQDAGQAIIGLVVMLITLAIWVIFLVLANIYMRVVFEVILLMFNMYDSLKAVEENTKGKK